MSTNEPIKKINPIIVTDFKENDIQAQRQFRKKVASIIKNVANRLNAPAEDVELSVQFTMVDKEDPIVLSVVDGNDEVVAGRYMLTVWLANSDFGIPIEEDEDSLAVGGGATIIWRDFPDPEGEPFLTYHILTAADGTAELTVSSEWEADRFLMAALGPKAASIQVFEHE